jgi:hypothetical protein
LRAHDRAGEIPYCDCEGLPDPAPLPIFGKTTTRCRTGGYESAILEPGRAENRLFVGSSHIRKSHPYGISYLRPTKKKGFGNRANPARVDEQNPPEAPEK